MKQRWQEPLKTARRCDNPVALTIKAAKGLHHHRSTKSQNVDRKKKLTIRLFLLGLSLILSACGILETRTPQPPAQTSSTFVPATSPDTVLANLINAVRERNTDNYIRCLVDSNFSDKGFSFIPTQEAQSKYPLAFNNWSLSSERGYFENLKSRTPSTAISLLFFSSQKFESLQSDSALFTGAYDLVFQHDQSGVPQEAKGTLQFYMATDRNKLWMIYRWVDLQTGSDFSWSEMKGRFGT
jgi:hypothetical protein